MLATFQQRPSCLSQYWGHKRILLLWYKKGYILMAVRAGQHLGWRYQLRWCLGQLNHVCISDCFSARIDDERHYLWLIESVRKMICLSKLQSSLHCRQKTILFGWRYFKRVNERRFRVPQKPTRDRVSCTMIGHCTRHYTPFCWYYDVDHLHLAVREFVLHFK